MISSTHSPWQLDPQLARDTSPLGELPLSRLLLNEDANYPWLIVVPRRAGLVELIDLDAAARAVLLEEISQVATVLKAVTRCHKLNVAALGNVVAQLHVHVIARFTSDTAWPNPVWGKAPRKTYERAVRDDLVGALRRGLHLPSE